MIDEPVTGLDPMVAAEMYDLLQKLNKDTGITIIMISHDIKSAIKYGNKILHLQTSPLFYGLTSEYLKTKLAYNMLGGDENV